MLNKVQRSFHKTKTLLGGEARRKHEPGIPLLKFVQPLINNPRLIQSISGERNAVDRRTT
jgi:hypothetical protein